MGRVFTTKYKRTMERKLRASDARAEKAKQETVEEAEGLALIEPLDLPPLQLLVRLTEDVGKLPAGLVYRLPTDVSNALIMRRKATPVADMAAFPDLDISEAELEVAGLYWPVIQA